MEKAKEEMPPISQPLISNKDKTVRDYNSGNIVVHGPHTHVHVSALTHVLVRACARATISVAECGHLCEEVGQGGRRGMHGCVCEDM